MTHYNLLPVTGNFEQRFTAMFHNLVMNKKKLKIKSSLVASNTECQLTFVDGLIVDFILHFDIDDPGVELKVGTIDGTSITKEQSSSMRFLYLLILSDLPEFMDASLEGLKELNEKFNIT